MELFTGVTFNLLPLAGWVPGLLTGPEARWSMLLHSVRVIWYNTVRVMEVSHERDKS